MVPHPSFIGVAIACGGNLLISLALNCQKLAHKRIEEQATPSPSGASSSSQTPKPTRQTSTFSFTASSSFSSPDSSHQPFLPVIYVEPATPIPCQTPAVDGPDQPQSGSPIDLPSNAAVKIKDVRRSGRDEFGRGDMAVYKQDLAAGKDAPVLVGTALPANGSRSTSLEQDSIEEISEDEEDTLRAPTANGNGNGNGEAPDGVQDTSEDPSPPRKELYLKSKLWWFGLLLMSIGEGGNFLSYGFAPASVVAPLGTVALIANCFLSPLMLGERFNWKDLLGVTLAILGAVTIVLSTKTSNPSLSPKSLLLAISQPAFIAYTVVTLVAILGLLALTHSKRFGGRWLGVDLGLCALFGGYTVLSTKALSSLLSRIFFDAFRYPITWVLIAVLAGTSVLQIRHLNRALMEFESKEVIPTQFVFFSISAIVGSAVLYQEFRDVTVPRLANFLFGIATTFVGVFLLTASSRPEPDEAEQHSAQEDQPATSAPALQSRRSSLKSHRSQLSPIAERVVLIPSRPLRAHDRNYNTLVFPGKKAMRKRSSTATLGGRGISSGGFLLLASSPSEGQLHTGGRSRSNSRGRGTKGREPVLDPL